MRNTHTVNVMWSDCDPARIVYHANYFRWMDDAAHILFKKAGFTFERLLDEYGIPGVPLVAAHADFRSPATLGDRLSIESRVSEFGTRSFTVLHNIFNGEGVVAEGWQKRVWCKIDSRDARKLTALPIPDDFKQALASS